MARSVNLAILVGNLTRDPQMRYTPNGTAVTSFSVATNRSWISEGKEQEAVDYHNIVVWNKLAETCNNLLAKGRKVYIKGRISNRSWDDSSGQKHYRTEIVADEVIFLDAPRGKDQSPTAAEGAVDSAKAEPVVEAEKTGVLDEEVNAEEIPF